MMMPAPSSAISTKESEDQKPLSWASLLMRFVSLVGGFLGLVLAWQGEGLIRTGDMTWNAQLFYLAGIIVFAASAMLSPKSANDLPDETPISSVRGASWWRWLLLFVGGLTSVALGFLSLSDLQRDLGSVEGIQAWGASFTALAVTALLLGRWKTWPARWGNDVYPKSPLGRNLFWGILAVIFAVTVGTRVFGLDQIPRGINPDEGDQGALAIQIIHGNASQPIFDYGWYFISMLYYWILAQVMKVAGISFAGARMFSAISGILTVITIIWIGVRHFGWRVGVLAGGILATLGVALQFSRELTMAAPTATLWAMSAACFLEAARSGRLAAWVGAGLTGGFSVYFYPTGRLWPVVAAAFCTYLLIHGLGGRRWQILRGIVFAALAALLIAAPFILRASYKNWESLTHRARETSVFVNNNAARLHYYNPEWSTPELVLAQVERSLGVFNKYFDMNAFWPTGKPLLPPPLAIAVFIGLGWLFLRPQDPRFVLLGIWFWVGFIGVIVTVETPNVHRMTAAVPVLALLPALLLDNLARRLEDLISPHRVKMRRIVANFMTGMAVLVMISLMVEQARFYFFVYGAMDEWRAARVLDEFVRDLGPKTQAFTMAIDSHVINQGWVRLVAPDTPRGALPYPGSDLPLALPANYDLAFMIMPRQMYYLPYVRSLYPGGIMKSVDVEPGNLLFNLYSLTKEQWQSTQGAFAISPQGSFVRVNGFGEVPEGWTAFPSLMRWVASWRVPQYWNYSLRIGPGPASLKIDGNLVLEVPEGMPAQDTQLSLASGDHWVELEGTPKGSGQGVTFEWAIVPYHTPEQPLPTLEWKSVPRELLRPVKNGPDGLFGVIKPLGRAEQHRIDGTFASGRFSEQVLSSSYSALYRGTLFAQVSGVYPMRLLAQGTAELKLDGQRILYVDAPQDYPVSGTALLEAGLHEVEFSYQVQGTPGVLEWTWIPPGGELSIVPRWVLAPPPGSGVGLPVAFDILGPMGEQPISRPLDIVK